MNSKRTIILTLCTGYADMTTQEVWTIPKNFVEDEIRALVDERAVEHAKMYGIYRSSDEDEEGTKEFEERYSGNHIEGSWKDYVEERDARKVT